MNPKDEFSVAGKVKVLRGNQKLYEGIVALLFPFGGKSAMKIELCNRSQLTFFFFQKLNGEEGWVLLPDPLPKNYSIDQEVILHLIEKII